MMTSVQNQATQNRELMQMTQQNTQNLMELVRQMERGRQGSSSFADLCMHCADLLSAVSLHAAVLMCFR